MAKNEEWPRAKVADFINEGSLVINDGYRVRNVELGATGIPFVRGGDIGDGEINTKVADHIRMEFSGRVAGKLTQPFDVAFITKGTVGRVGMLRADQPRVVFAPQVSYWRSTNPRRIEPRFLLHLIRSQEFQGCLHAVKTHGAMVADYVSLSDQRKFELPVPPIDHQRSIACVLGTLDDKIEVNRRRNRTLEAMARAIFQSWFADFDPVRAKADDRAPAGLSADLATLFPDSFDGSALGPIPKGWRVGTVGEIADIVGGSTPSTKESSYWEAGQHWWATPKDLAPLSVPVLLDTERRITDAGLAQISSGLLPLGTVLLSSRAPIGYLAITQAPVAINQGFIAMRPRNETSAHFLLRWAESAEELILSRANGSTFLEISKSNFRPIPLVIPGQEIHTAFDRILSPCYEQVVRNERESRTLAALRDALLPKLISGALRVPDAERIIGRTT